MQLQKARLIRSDFDYLTGLISPVHMDQYISEALNQLRQESQPFAFGYLDIDGLKKINGKYGRDFGDDVIKRFAERIKIDLRCRDQLSRMTGAQFALILRDIEDLADITALSKAWLKSANLGLQVRDNKIAIEFSAGFIFIKDHRVTIGEVYQLAYLQMQKVKEQGKNGAISAVLHGSYA